MILNILNLFYWTMNIWQFLFFSFLFDLIMILFDWFVLLFRWALNIFLFAFFQKQSISIVFSLLIQFVKNYLLILKSMTDDIELVNFLRLTFLRLLEGLSRIKKIWRIEMFQAWTYVCGIRIVLKAQFTGIVLENILIKRNNPLASYILVDFV